MDRSSGLGLPTHPPSRHSINHDSDCLGFRSLHGCGAAGDSHPSSSHPSVYELIYREPCLKKMYKKIMMLCQEKINRKESSKYSHNTLRPFKTFILTSCDKPHCNCIERTFFFTQATSHTFVTIEKYFCRHFPPRQRKFYVKGLESAQINT